MSDRADGLAALVQERFESRISSCDVFAGQVTVSLPAGELHAVCLRLRDEDAFRFEQLIDLCAVDYSTYGQGDWETSESATSGGFSRGVEPGAFNDVLRPVENDRFAVVYHLLSHAHNQRIRVRTMSVGDPPRVDSVVDVWRAADWFEREAFDLYGVLFEGHPDLRRILTDYGFIGHPFRKDFPLTGHVEMCYDPEKGRVVYRPVSIEPRTLVPRVIRHDERYSDETSPRASANEA